MNTEEARTPAWDEVARRLTAAYRTRIVLISPPRTGSTVVARLLWQHSAIGYHCHEPFEAGYWGTDGDEALARILLHPMEVASGERVPLERVPDGAGLLVKEMSFQLDGKRFDRLAATATAPVVFVMRDPRLCVSSRLRVLGELGGATTFPPFEGGWQSLGEQIGRCRARGVPHLLVDSGELRGDPEGMTLALVTRLGLAGEADLHRWSARPGLRLCLPEVGELMGGARTGDDPFYRRVLASERIQPVDEADWAREEAVIDAAGLTGSVRQWLTLYRELRKDPARVEPAVGQKAAHGD